MSNRQVRVRFAPSPTGPLHIGGVRTALFNYLFAKKNGGKFILRIEDTDQTRFVPGAEEYINESLRWLGLIPDEGVREGGPFGPYKQSERKDIYRQYARELVDKGWAYYAFDSASTLDQLRAEHEAQGKTFAYDLNTRMSMSNSLTLSPEEVTQKINGGENWVIRFKMPANIEVHATDLVRGDVTFHTNTLDDKVLFKSADDLPTYHLANIVDDHLMEITHVIRGEEWLPSLPLHVLLYRAFNWEETMPAFAHLSLILKPSGKGKLSKRDGDKDGFPVFPIEWRPSDGEVASGYRESGYFPDAVVNLLALLGWNPGTEQEIFTLDELASFFSLDRVNKSGARFDPEKAKWFNHQYLMMRTNAELASLFKCSVAQKDLHCSDEMLQRIVGLVKERVNFVNELWGQSYFFFERPTSYDEKVVSKRWKDGVPEYMGQIIDVFKQQTQWNAEAIKETVSGSIVANQQNFGTIMNALRLVMVGGSFGPDLFTIIEIIGREESIERIRLAIEKLKI